MRAHLFASTLCLALSLASIGCGGPSGDGDAGIDAGSDAGGDIDVDAGRDGGIPGPFDAGPRDAMPPVDGGPILPPADAGDPFGDAGVLGTPEWVDLQVLVDGTTCTALTACGGDVVGTWDVTGGCIEIPVPAMLMECPGAEVTVNTGRARGRVTFTATTSTRLAQSEVEVMIFIPGFCTSFVPGGCPGIETAIRDGAPGTDVRCVVEDAGSHCSCAVRKFTVIDDSDGYTIETNQIVSATLGKRWDYCIESTEMRYEDVSESGTLEPGIIELGRRIAL